MVRIRTLAGGIAAWIALSSTAAAAPLSWFDSQASLTAWYANQLNAAGNIYAPQGGANAITNLPSNWYARPSVPAAAAPAVVAAPTPAPVQASVQAASVAPLPVASPVGTVSVPPVAAASNTPTAPAALAYTPQPTFGPSTNRADAFINMGAGPYAEASTLTVGTPQPWYQSPAAVSAFGGAPSPTQQDQFASDVLSKVERTFEMSGVPVNLTDDPSVPAARMMSVVSGASYGPNPNAIGITRVGGDGFSFIDKLSYASNEDQLSWAVAHNVAHELMHGFGIGQHPDATGEFIDAAAADWSMLTDPDSKFSPAAVALLQNVSSNGIDSGSIGSEVFKTGLLSAQCHCQVCDASLGLGVEGAQEMAAAVPEPSTIAVWALAGLGGALAMRRRGAKAA